MIGSMCFLNSKGTQICSSVLGSIDMQYREDLETAHLASYSLGRTILNRVIRGGLPIKVLQK